MTDQMTSRPAPGTPPNPPATSVGPGRTILRIGALIGAAGFVAFWTWALFFASKEPINRIGDTAWQERAQSVCEAADRERLELADFRVVEEGGPELVRERATIVDRATDILEQMLDDVVAVTPADAKGQDLVPQWEADYRAYLDSRRVFADTLRDTGINSPFYEPDADGIPISEKIETFAGDNRMPACAPPRDLTR
jgi:hypothetical protein